MRPAALLFVATLGCGAPKLGLPCDGSDGCRYAQSTSVFEVSYERRIDLLIVMDDSASMGARQQAIAARLAPELEKIPGGLPELRIRVVSSTVPAPGLAGFPGCAAAADPRTCAPPATGFIETTNICGQHPNYAGSFEEAFRCFAATGTAGCGWEQPLAAARAAVEGDPQDGSVFLRPDAHFALVIITDEDDCSAPADATLFGAPPSAPDDPALAFRCHAAGVRCAGQPLGSAPTGVALDGCVPAADGGGLVPVDEYVRFFQTLKPRPEQATISVLAGAPTSYTLDGPAGAPIALRPTCQYGGSPVLPAVRLRAFADAFAEQRGSMTDLCAPNGDVAAVLEPIGEVLAIKLGVPCLPESLVDGDPTRVGIQPACTVTEQSLADPAGHVLPTCDRASAPCWAAIADDACTSGFHTNIDRGGCLPPDGTELTFRCETTPGR